MGGGGSDYLIGESLDRLSVGEEHIRVSPNTSSIGKGNTTGIKGFYWSSIDTSNNQIVLQPRAELTAEDLLHGVPYDTNVFIMPELEDESVSGSFEVRFDGTIESCSDGIIVPSGSSHDLICINTSLYGLVKENTPITVTVGENIYNYKVLYDIDTGSVECPFQQDDVLNMVATAKAKRYTRCCKITSVTSDWVLTVDKFPDDNDFITEIPNIQQYHGFYNNCITCPDRPDLPVGVILSKYSIALGRDNKALEHCTFVSGRENKAVGQYATVTGHQNEGSYATFVSGKENIVDGWYSTSTGQKNTVNGKWAVGIGYGNKVPSECGIAIGESNEIHYRRASAIGYKNFVNGDSAFTAGENNVVNSHYSSAIGKNNAIASINAVALGTGNHVHGEGATATGTSNTVNGNKAFAAGSDNQIINSAYGAVALGYENTVTGEGAVAIGGNNSSNGYRNITLGKSITSKGWDTFASGYGHSIDGNHNFVAGKNNTITGSNSTVLGNSNTITGGYAKVLGEENTITCDWARAFGYKNTVSGIEAIAVGRIHTVSGQNAIAIGNTNIVSGGSAIAIGKQNTALGENGIAIGWDAHSNYKGSNTLGVTISTYANEQTVIGKFSAEDSYASVIIANGSVGDEQNVLSFYNENHPNNRDENNDPIVSTCAEFSVPVYAPELYSDGQLVSVDGHTHNYAPRVHSHDYAPMYQYGTSVPSTLEEGHLYFVYE